MRLIDADYLKQMFDVACGANREVFNIADSVYNFAIKIIDDAPTVERLMGEWKQISPAKIYECTNCGQTVMTGDIECYQFCHNCGAEMRGKEADNAEGCE